MLPSIAPLRFSATDKTPVFQIANLRPTNARFTQVAAPAPLQLALVIVVLASLWHWRGSLFLWRVGYCGIGCQQ